MKTLTLVTLLSCALLLGASAQRNQEQLPRSTPTEESTKLASVQLDREIAELKDAIAGMKAAIDKGDRATFKLYRIQARDALLKIEKLTTSEITAESKSAAQPKSPSPTATPSPTISPEPTVTPEMEATATPSPSATVTPTVSPFGTPSPTQR